MDSDHIPSSHCSSIPGNKISYDHTNASVSSQSFAASSELAFVDENHNPNLCVNAQRCKHSALKNHNAGHYPMNHDVVYQSPDFSRDIREVSQKVDTNLGSAESRKRNALSEANVRKVRSRGRNVDKLFSELLPRTPLQTIDGNQVRTTSSTPAGNYQSPTNHDIENQACRFLRDVHGSRQIPEQNLLSNSGYAASSNHNASIDTSVKKVRTRSKNVDKLFSGLLPRTPVQNNDVKQLRSTTSTTTGSNNHSRITKQSSSPFQRRLPQIDLNNGTHREARPKTKQSHYVPDPVVNLSSTVKSTYEVGESSSSRNLNCEFEHAVDGFTSDSDTSTYGDPDDWEAPEIDSVGKVWKQYMDFGTPDIICKKCDSIMWNAERNNKRTTRQTATFSLCCKNGQVVLEKEKHAPEPLASLLSGDSRSKEFKKLIRIYNCMFAMTSMGGKIDHKINRGGAPYCFKIEGQNLHHIGSFLPEAGEIPKFCQLYIYDTENEVNNRINAVNGSNDVVDPEIVQSLLQMLDQHNRLVSGFRMARERVKENPVDEFKLLLISSSSASGRPNHIGPSNEVAGLIVTDNNYTKSTRDTIIDSRVTGLERIWETDPRFMQLQYPLIFPHGDEGFHLDLPLNKPIIPATQHSDGMEVDETNERGPRTKMTMKEYYNYKLMIRLSEGLTSHLCGRLWQQYIVDAFTAVEQYRLDWIRNHQTTIRADLYHNIRDAVNKGDHNPEHLGKAIILPASFTGSQRYMNQYFKDSLAICRILGHPSLFLTMTTNTKWPEIQRMLKYMPGVDVVDAPDVVSRVFKLKVEQLIDLIKNKNYFGRCIGVMHVIEFQKRGLPHAHMLIWLHPDDRPKNFDQIDSMVSAEIPDPDKDRDAYEAVKNYMIHGPCGSDNLQSACMIKGKCGKHFPKKYNAHTFFDGCGFPIYKRRKTGVYVKKSGVHLDNRFVVPYNRDLLLRFQCHMNLEICNSSRSLKYLFKYCLKGHDTATMLLKKKANANSQNVLPHRGKKPRDEVKHYLDGRYVCASEAAWRIFGFDIHSRWPSVDRLPIHLPGDKNVSFKCGDDLQEVFERATSKKTKLEAWFDANRIYTTGRNCTYPEFPSKFTWQPKSGTWKERKRGDVLGRLSEVHTSSGELFYLRMLLLRIKGATSFDDLKTVDGHLYGSFKETCSALGLLKEDNQWHEAISENAHTALPPQLREIFVNILAYSPISDPLRLWETHWKCMSDDVLIKRRHVTNDPGLILSDEAIQQYTLAEIEKLLNNIGKSLRDFPKLPFPGDSYFSTTSNHLITEETGYDKEEMRTLHQKNLELLNSDQKKVYDSIVASVNEQKGELFFVYGSGGCGKTFLWQTLCCRLRAEGKIVLPVASSGIAAVLLPGGRTAHSRFHIPLKLDPYSTAGIRHGTPEAELIQNTNLIIWDEAPMQHRHAFEAVDRCLRDIMSAVDRKYAKKPFGGITTVFGGDFRQILPVIPKAPRPVIVGASLNRSRLWEFCQVYLLRQNMRLHAGNTEEENRIISEFSRWQLSIGDGKEENIVKDAENGEMMIKIPQQFILHSTGNPVETIFNKTYPDFVQNRSSPPYLRSRAILTPTNVIVDDINTHILDMIPGEIHTYLSQDSIDDCGDEDNDFRSAFPIEYLNSLNMPCTPKHELKLKVGVVVMLMRNLNQIMGLCNGTRMVVTSCKKNSIECEILCGSQVGSKHLIPRIEMIPTDTGLPFDLKRIQFPVQVCYSMTINKSQGQSLDTVGLYLPRSAFSHGHIYVAISRVTRPHGLHILIVNDDGSTTDTTANVVFEEVFYNLPSIDDNE